MGDYVVQNHNVELGVPNEEFTITNIDVDPLPFGVIPTNEQIAAEDHRRRTLIDRVPNMNNLDAAQRELRYHDVLTRVNGVAQLPQGLMHLFEDILQTTQNMEQTQLETLESLQDHQGRLQNHQHRLEDHLAMLQDHHALIQGAFEAIHRANQRITTLLEVMTARSRNKQFRRRQMNVHLAILPKVYAGHPFPVPEPVQGVNIDMGGYLVGDMPPNGLMPLTNNEFATMLKQDLPILRRRLRAIYWFYNDADLEIPPDATEERCNEGVECVRMFICP
ncbi:Unknown protein [Striga hermonthica]|uniref:Uncharacterized protein n=1 Tax=Striga hermonthica TaxID=68872 RepID=A0A9N7MTG6_STRHE|nr:Unknown protein [Striga hermonthica]